MRLHAGTRMDVSERAFDMLHEGLDEIPVTPIVLVAERRETRNQTSIQRMIAGDAFGIAVAQILERPAQYIIFIVVIMPFKRIVEFWNGFDETTAQTSNENWNIASGG